ncbi:hypothetical protein SASPL_153284 [Salvia splendens]|uniref:C2 NT-type domain-containing protein n=1 Tax=Salvia splendens TaxID=180675 RepID=A0A8X8W4J5_SALSN|nr:uncharacterized protein LOC121785414 [Salvia splendens]KAG6388087.1 hypothetical protein SASPL_153284 [Salvia splendens]
MAVKMRKWSPWPPTRKFAVAMRLMRLEVMAEDGGGDDEDGGYGAAAQKFVAIKIKWKGEPKFLPLMSPFQPRKKVERSSNRDMKKGGGIVEWDEDPWFENTCCFSIASDKKFGPWEVAFSVICGEKADSKAKMAVIGGASINITEIVSKMESSSIEEKLHLNLQIDEIAREAALTMVFKCVEIRESHNSAAPSRSKSIDLKCSFADESRDKSRRRSLSLEEACLDEPGVPESRTLEPDKKDRWFSWKSRRFSFKRAKTKEETRVHSASLSSTNSLQKEDGRSETADTVCEWEDKELMSRDGQAQLKAPFFFASFDQRSDKAAGASACTALVAVISHWLHSNPNAMPGRSELDDLIMQGSSEWRKLCEDAAYVKDFPNKHFDLETVLRADIRPVSISRNESFVGFFGAETFDSLKGAMSFDDLWDEIRGGGGDTAPRIYIVSWNDHFFVLKVEADAYYIIDTLGERLYEGCNQAYMIRFDEKAVIQVHKPAAETAESEQSTGKVEVICSGKECCREFIKRFLAAIPLKELEEEEKKSTVSYFCLHQRLQIEFNYSCLISPASSSSTPSPLSSLTTSASSPTSD